jgi:ATP-dependent helicase/nuclease subunit A
VTLSLFETNDDEARRQIRELLDETLFVEASAGTGKTSALVERYVALVLAGRPVERLIAITFTEKAAAELRDRVRGALEKQVIEHGEQPLIATALASLDQAPISTIHAFAYAVLRSFAAEAGIDPAFEVQDEVMAERRFETRWRTFLEDLGREPEAVAAVERVLALGLTTRDLETLAHELWTHTATAEQLAIEPLTATPAPWPDLEAMRLTLVESGYERAVDGDYLRGDIEALLRVLTQLASTSPEDREAYLARRPAILRRSFGTRGRQDNWGGSARIAQARERATAVAGVLNLQLEALRSEALAGVMPLVTRFVIEDARARCREGQVVFDDLILRLRDILRDSFLARRELRNRYDALLIDEFQDTDPLQVDIGLSFGRRHEDGALEPGRLFLVGDPKQSIYRFRRADMAIYQQTRELVTAAGGRFPVLSLNRRSRRPLLDWVNAVFDRLIGAGERPQLQPPYRPLRPDRDDAPAGPGVAWTGGETEASARDSRYFEAGQIAAYCRLATDGWEVTQRDGSLRSATYHDIAVLIPGRTVLQPLEQALAAAGIPYRVEGGSLVYGTQEVRDLINCLTAIDDPTDEVAVVGALRSPAYACSDVELARHRLNGGGFNYLAPLADDADGPVVAAMRSLRAFHDERHAGTLAALVERFVNDRRLVEIGLYDAGSRNSFRRARFVIEQARVFEAARPESLRAFVTWLERRAGEAILDHEGAGLDDDEDAVRILTVHAAKGLEFPIVFLAGLGVAPVNRGPLLGVDRTNGRIALAIGSKTAGAQFTLGPYEEVSDNERAHLEAERNRLLYVAATRARDHLIVSLYHSRRTYECDARRLIEAGARDNAIELPEIAPITGGATPLQGLTTDALDVSVDDFLARREALVEDARRLKFTSATALGRELKLVLDNGDEDKSERDDESEPWARGRAGTHRGRAVHAAIQSLPWDADDETIAAVATAQAVAEAVPDQHDRIAELIKGAFETQVAARAREASRALREVPFAVKLGDVIVEGFIDLVIETPDGIEIVDWKTDAVPEGGVDKRLEEYELQAGLYVLGIEEATAKPVQRLTYVFLDPQQERSPGEPADLKSKAREELRQRLGAP